MNYMTWIERSAENLKFFLWYKDYTERFESIKDTQKALAPEWTEAQHEAALAHLPTATRGPKKTNPANEIFKGTDFEESNQKINESADPFSTPPTTSNGRRDSQPWTGSTSEISSSMVHSSNAEAHRQHAGEAFEQAGLKLPFTIQPFREEIDRVIGTYIVNDAVCELNLSGRERAVLLKALEYTTHPSAFRDVIKTIESSLRRQSHPNFIRWTICNGNRPRVIFARGLGIFLVLVGILIAVLFTLSTASKGLRAIGAIFWVLGFSTLFAAYNGMCVVLHGLHHRHLRPWELFEDPEMENEKKESFDSVWTSQSYEDQPWVIKYEKRNVIRKIFDREVWIQEPALRQIQDTIFIQAMISALVFAGILVAIFVNVPGADLF